MSADRSRAHLDHAGDLTRDRDGAVDDERVGGGSAQPNLAEGRLDEEGDPRERWIGSEGARDIGSDRRVAAQLVPDGLDLRDRCGDALCQMAVDLSADDAAKMNDAILLLNRDPKADGGQRLRVVQGIGNGFDKSRGGGRHSASGQQE